VSGKSKLPKDWICPGCNDPTRKYVAKGLCGRCYDRAHYGYTKFHHSAERPCIECGAKPVQAEDLCKRCYMKKYRKRNRVRIYSQKTADREVDRFGGRRELIAKRAEGKCERCGITEDTVRARTGHRLVVHHKDGHGLSSDMPNHAFDNLMLLCVPCHRKVHAEMGRTAKT
jgi:hypothetical protein